MIVKKSIGSIKIGNTVSRLTVGKPVPENVLAYWKKTKQYEELKKHGIIGEKPKDPNEEKIKRLNEMRESYKTMNPEKEESKKLLKEIENLEKEISGK